MNLFSKLFDIFHKKEKPTLRELCIREYGEEFGFVYDDLNSGAPIGGFAETIIALNMIESVQSKYRGLYRQD